MFIALILRRFALIMSGDAMMAHMLRIHTTHTRDNINVKAVSRADICAAVQRLVLTAIAIAQTESKQTVKQL
jgi:hypothetical protein